MAFEEVYRAGTKYENLVRIERRDRSPNLYYRIWKPEQGGYVRRSLGHSDLEAAKEWADDQAAKIRRGKAAIATGRITLERGFRLYLERHTPTKATENERREDRRRMKMWKRVLGPDKDPEDIKGSELNLFRHRRKSGELNSQGEIVEAKDAREPVRWATVRSDMRWLRSFLLWLEDEDLITAVRVKRKHIPEDSNPRRPIATQDRVEAIREVYNQPKMQVAWSGDMRKVDSFLPPIFELAVGTGRRIGAIRTLQHRQLQLDEGRCGRISWEPDQKGGIGNAVDIPLRTRRALDNHLHRMRELLGGRIGEAYLFPGARDTNAPISQNSVNRWLREAENLAEVKPQDGTLWHAYRRMWATARKGHPAHDVARAGGWAGPQTLERVYQAPEEDRVANVVHNPGEVRKVYGEE